MSEHLVQTHSGEMVEATHAYMLSKAPLLSCFVSRDDPRFDQKMAELQRMRDQNHRWYHYFEKKWGIEYGKVYSYSEIGEEKIEQIIALLDEQEYQGTQLVKQLWFNTIQARRDFVSKGVVRAQQIKAKSASPQDLCAVFPKEPVHGQYLWVPNDAQGEYADAAGQYISFCAYKLLQDACLPVETIYDGLIARIAENRKDEKTFNDKSLCPFTLQPVDTQYDCCITKIKGSVSKAVLGDAIVKLLEGRYVHKSVLRHLFQAGIYVNQFIVFPESIDDVVTDKYRKNLITDDFEPNDIEQCHICLSSYRGDLRTVISPELEEHDPLYKFAGKVICRECTLSIRRFNSPLMRHYLYKEDRETGELVPFVYRKNSRQKDSSDDNDSPAESGS